jgi:hypothetical protein
MQAMSKMVTVLRSIRLLDAFLWAVGLACGATIFLAHEKPFARAAFCARIQICPRLPFDGALNKIAYDLAVGAIVTLVFYWLVVRLPERQKRARLRKSLAAQYRIFKEDCISTMLGTVRVSYSIDFLEGLLDRKEFKRYFNEKVGNGQDRWDQFFNELDDYGVRDLIKQMAMLRDEIAFVLNNVDIPGEAPFAFLKRFDRAIYLRIDSTSKYEDKEVLLKFLWEVFAGWSFATGYQERDIIQDMIDAI